jgi:protein disulfide-isomerase
MKSLSAFLFVLAFAIPSAWAQGYSATMDGWLVDVNEAYQLQEQTGKPILANFTGSDWCGWCKRLKSSVFVKDEFQEWADDNVILLELDFPRRFQLPDDIQQQNYQMAQALGVRGYPTIWIFTIEKNESTNQMNLNAMGKTGYRPTAQEFIADCERIITHGNN